MPFVSFSRFGLVVAETENAISGWRLRISRAIVVISKRARQINEELKIEFNQRLETLQSRTTESEEEIEQPQTNPDQILIAQEFEIRPKPTETSLDEMMDNKLEFRYKEPETPLAE